MRSRRGLVTSLLAPLVVALLAVGTSGCSEAEPGLTSGYAHRMLDRWARQVVGDIGHRTVVSHSTPVFGTDDCGDWSSVYTFSTMLVSVPFYRLQESVRAILADQRARGWDTSGADTNVTSEGAMNTRLIQPSHAGKFAGMVIAGGPSSNGVAELDITLTSDCFAP